MDVTRTRLTSRNRHEAQWATKTHQLRHSGILYSHQRLQRCVFRPSQCLPKQVPQRERSTAVAPHAILNPLLEPPLSCISRLQNLTPAATSSSDGSSSCICLSAASAAAAAGSSSAAVLCRLAGPCPAASLLLAAPAASRCCYCASSYCRWSCWCCCCRASCAPLS